MARPRDLLLQLSQPENNQQWHLQQRDAGEFDLNVLTAWEEYTGEGIDVFVIDDGFDYLHSDLAPNYDTSRDQDYNENDADPFGASTDSHGTAVMGIIGADDNGDGAVGIAFDATVIGYRTNGFISDTWLGNIRDGIHDAAVNGGDVVNISQGMANAFSTIFGGVLSQTLVQAIRTEIDFAVDTGRGGLGTIIVKSAGNSRGTLYDVNADMWTNDTQQVVVAAVDQNGAVSSYSSFGAANLVSGFGTPGEVVTTDRTGSAGYNAAGDHTGGFNGTSSAAPMVSGVVALILDANENLGWRDVQNILAVSARHVGSDLGGPLLGSEREAWSWNSSAKWNGGGMHYSTDYGYGLVDATAGVRLAESWLLGVAAQTSANEVSTFEDGLNTATVIPDGNAEGTTFNIAETDAIQVERVTLTVTFQTTFLQDVQIYLISPGGQSSTLTRGSGGSGDFNGTWTFESQAFRGISSAGTWKIKIVDSASGDALTVSDLQLRTFGRASDVNDRYVFTNEYSDFAGIGGHSVAIVDSNGGIDTINAAAVTSGSIIDLRDGSSSTIDGVSLTLTMMENAIGGDGNDMLTGKAGANKLYGFRGNDTLNGLGGTDLLDGGTGNDTYVLGANNATIVDASGNDTITSTVSRSLTGFSMIENLTLSGSSAINATGNSLANVLTGNGVNNVLNGGLGNDDLRGGTGTDTAAYNAIATAVTVNLNGISNGSGTIHAIGQGSDIFSSIENVIGSSKDDSITGNSGNNQLDGSAGADVLNGAGGNDKLLGGEGEDTLLGGAGNDSLDGGTGVDELLGGTGDDTYVLGNTSDFVSDTGGTDTITSTVSRSLAAFGAIEKLLLLGTGNINGTGNSLANTIVGNSGNNLLDGGAGADILNGGNGNDTYALSNGTDTVLDSGGIDTITSTINRSLTGFSSIENLTLLGSGNIAGTGNGLNNTILGNSGKNALSGGSGKDTLKGNSGDDTIKGDAGDDVLFGGSGKDTLSGGTNKDTFVFDTALAASNLDKITDFNVADDIIRLENAIFTALTTLGTLASGAFAKNATGQAADNSDRIIYETDTGNLFYDSNGKASGGSVLFATLTKNLNLTNNDFVIV